MKPSTFVKHRRIFPCALMLIAAVLSACASLEQPRISLSDMDVRQTTGFETILQARLRVLNPNDIELNIRGLDCSLEINGKPFARGISNAAVNVPPFDSAIVPVTVYSSAFDIARSLISMPGRDEVSYELTGKLRLEKKGRLFNGLSFKSGGTMSLQDFEAWLAPRSRTQ
jgi:LEA14-like dessication related protein